MSRQKDFQVMSLEPGTTEVVYIGHVTDPDTFYVQLERTADSLDEIMNLMQTYYKEGDNSGEALPSLVLGAPCAALYTDGEWYRARVTGLLASGMVEVLFVDFGNTDFVSKDNVRALRPDLYATPIQSFRCRLQGVAATQDFWSPQHVAQFEDSVLEKSFTATFMSCSPDTQCYAVQLVDESGVNINKKFGELTGSAVIEASANPKVKRSVQTMGELDLHVTVQTSSGAAPKPRGIAHALGVHVSEGSPASSIPTVPPISLKVGEKVNVGVVFVSTPSEFWCQLKKFSEQNDRLTEEMAKAYSSMGPGEGLLRTLRPGCVCAALFDTDQTWYRATVEKVTGREVTVYFLDYGNTETVSAGNIRELKEEFRALPAQAVKCSLSGVASPSGNWTDDAAAAFEDMVLEKEYVANVISKEPNGSHVVSLVECGENTDVATSLINNHPDVIKGSAKAASVSPRPSAGGASLPSFSPLPVRVPSRCQVFVSWVTTPGDFYVQLADNHSILDSLTDDLQSFYNGPKASPVASVQLGMMVVAKFSEDKAWYRGVVRGISGNTADVQFVDFGNSEKVQFDSLKQIDRQFCNIPAQAGCCSLSGVRPLTQGQTWSGDAKDFLETLTGDGAMCHFLVKKGDVLEVELEVGGKSIAKEMVAHAVVRGASEPPSDGGSRFQQYRFEKLQTGQRAEVYVAFAESVVSFYVQLADRMQELDELMAELETHYNSGVGKPLLNPQVGMPCAARYNEDGLWYRARVKAFTAKDVDVFFVDYGNTQVANKDAVYQMEPAFMSLAAQAIQCSLDVREGRGADAQLTHFNQFTGDAKLELVVKGQDGSKLLVDLLKNGLSLTTEIKGGSPAQSPPKTVKPGEYTPAAVAPGQTVQAFASFIESTSKFWIQLAGCDGDLDAIMKHLSQQYESGVQPALATPTPGQACCALYAEDQLWYRASVLSIHGQQIKVRFVDYGNAELVDRENVKPISPDILSKPVMAIECCLEGFQSASMTDAALEATETLLAEKEITVTFTGGKNVRVTVDGADAGKVLSDKGFGGQQQTTLPSPKSPPAQSGFGSRSPQSAGKAGGGFGARSPPAPVLGSQTLKDPSPPSGSSDAIITHLEDDNGMFFVQLLSAETQLEQLSSKLQSVFSSGGLPLSGPPTKDMVCCARFSVDGCWYRSKIESISGGKAKVRFVDYGNAEVVQVNGLKAVPADLLTVPVQAFPCRLKGLPAWTKQTALAFSRAALDVQVKVRFVSSSSPFHVQISVKGQDLLQLLSRSPASSPQKPFGAASQDRPRGSPPSQGFGGKQDAQSSRPSPQSFGGAARHGGFGSPQKFGSPPQKPSFPQQVYQAQKPPTGKQNAYVSHVSDDGTFYLQLSHEAEKIEEITGKLQSLASSVHPDPVVGAACTAKFSEDGAWYRAVIKATSGASADVLFVDFGNGEKSAISSLRPLPADLLIPATAYHCQLEETGPLAPEQLEMFNTATEDKQLTAAFSPGNPMSVTLWDENGKNLVETLFPLGTLKPQKVPQETAPALVSHVCDNGLFYVHLNREENELLALHENLHRSYAGQVEKLESFGEGQICCAKFSEDEAWYRAVVLKDLNDSASVLFVDYGNTDIVNKDNILKLLPGLNQPPFAYECRLQGVVKWTEDQKKKFVAMTEGKRMNVRFLSSKAPYTVELTRSIELDLIEENAPQNGTAAVSGEEKSEKAAAESAPRFNGEASSAELATFPSQTPPGTGLGIVSHVDGEGIFFLQLHSEDETRETLSERLQEECESAESVKPVLNMACCAKYSEDEAWYRAVVEKVEAQAAIVRFIDFGNTDHVPFSDLKNVSAESLSVAPLAYCCFLEGCESVQDLVTEKLEEYTADQTLTVTFTSPAKLPPHSVRLQLEDGSNVATLLLSSNNNTAAEGNLVEETEAASGVKNEGLGTGSEVKLEGSERKSSTLMVGRQKVTVGHMVSPSLFYVQREDQQSEVDKQLDAMFEHYSSLAEGDGLVEHPTVGQLCASQFGEDGSWYRACIRSVDKETDTLTLFYVDYGNTEMVPASSVRLLLPEFETLPWQAVACSLAGVRCQGDEWTEEVKAAFSELIAEKSVLADVIAGSGEDGAYVVNLLDLGISVASSLLERGLPGIEAVEVESSVKHIFDDTTVGESLLSDSEDKFEDTVQDASEDGGARAGQSEKRTVDELEDNENEVEFSRQLNQRAAQLESTMLDEPADGKVSPQEQDTTGVAEENATKDNEDKVEEDEDDFQDAMETGGAKGEEKVNKQADDDHQLKFSCVAEGLAELEWIDVRVCSARSAEEFWCQLPSAQDDLVRIESDANSTAGPEKVQNVQIGHVYLVCDPQATIYRAKVLTADEGVESVSVLKVDHGEVETVTKTCLFHLTNDQLSVPAQAFACCLDDGVQPKHAWFLDLVSRGEMCDREFQLKVVGRKTDGTLLVDLREAPSGEDSSQLVKDTTEIREKEAGGEENEEGKKKAVGEMSMNQTLEFSQPILQSTVLGETMWQSRIDKSDAEREFSVQYLEVNKEYEALATARGVPDAFYLSLTSAQGMLNALADDIAAEVAEKPDDVGLTESAAVGSPCLVQDKTSSSWLRGQVKSVAGELCKVLCVDSGACVEARKADLRELPSRFLDTPVQAVLCSLADLVPVDGQWCDDALTFFTDFLSQGTLRVYVCGYSADGSVCRVTVLEQQTQSNNTTAFSRTGNEPSLNRTLVELGYAEAVAGSALDVELQLERTINDPDKLEQFESSFTEVSCQRENSISDVSGEDEEAEGENQAEENGMVDEKGDASKLLPRESEHAVEEKQELCDSVSSGMESGVTSTVHGDNTGADIDLNDSGDFGAANQTVVVPPDTEGELLQACKSNFDTVLQELLVKFSSGKFDACSPSKTRHADTVKSEVSEKESCECVCIGGLDEGAGAGTVSVLSEKQETAELFVMEKSAVHVSDDAVCVENGNDFVQDEQEAGKFEDVVSSSIVGDSRNDDLECGTCLSGVNGEEDLLATSSQGDKAQSPLSLSQITRDVLCLMNAQNVQGGDDIVVEMQSESGRRVCSEMSSVHGTCSAPNSDINGNVCPDNVPNGEVYISDGQAESGSSPSDHLLEGRMPCESSSDIPEQVDTYDTGSSQVKTVSDPTDVNHGTTPLPSDEPDEKDVLCSVSSVSVSKTTASAEFAQEEIISRDGVEEESTPDNSLPVCVENSLQLASNLDRDLCECPLPPSPLLTFDASPRMEAESVEKPTLNEKITSEIEVPLPTAAMRDEAFTTDLPLSGGRGAVEQIVSSNLAPENRVSEEEELQSTEISSVSSDLPFCGAIAEHTDQPLEEVQTIIRQLVASVDTAQTEKFHLDSQLDVYDSGTLTPVEVSPNECSEREEDDSGDDKLVTALELEAMTVQMESMAVLEADQREADDAEELLEQMAELIDQYGNIINPLGDSELCEGSDLNHSHAEPSKDTENGLPTEECSKHMQVRILMEAGEQKTSVFDAGEKETGEKETGIFLEEFEVNVLGDPENCTYLEHTAGRDSEDAPDRGDTCAGMQAMQPDDDAHLFRCEGEQLQEVLEHTGCTDDREAYGITCEEAELAAEPCMATEPDNRD